MPILLWYACVNNSTSNGTSSFPDTIEVSSCSLEERGRATGKKCGRRKERERKIVCVCVRVCVSVCVCGGGGAGEREREREREREPHPPSAATCFFPSPPSSAMLLSSNATCLRSFTLWSKTYHY